MASITDYRLTGGERRWRVKYYDGSKKQHKKEGFLRKCDAEAYAARMKVSIDDGDYIDPQLGKISVNRLAATWLDGKRARLKPKYWNNLESSWRVHVAPKWGRRRISTIRHSEVQAWISAMSEQTSATTVRRAFDVLNGICKTALADRIIKHNPCDHTELPRKVAKPRTYLTVAQLKALADAAGDHKALILVLGCCGLRWGEATALRVKDVDVARSRLLVRQSVVRTNEGMVLGLPKTWETRDVPVPPSVMNILLGEIVGRDPDDLLFPGRTQGGWLGEVTRSGRNWYARALEASGAPSLTVHDLRHTAASIAISAGANVKAVQRMLGHKTAAMTLDTYADLFDDDLDAVAMDIERRLNETARA